LVCGGDHHISVCQECEPGDYKAPFFGSEEFGSGFYSIPVPDEDNYPVEQLNYAHITVEKGEVNCRNIEHEFNVWAESMKINWRFFAKEVSATEFRTRFPSAKTIEELAHFGKLFMRTVPGAIISLEKWAGDIEPISNMQEAWFRIKGIPMKFRNKSTVFYAASLVGKPLGLDKNYLRHFAYVSVKIGSQDLALVPNSRIAKIKKGFYELQYSRELFDPTSNNGNKSAIPVDNPGNEGDHGSPKRQRVGLQDSDVGSQSAPPKVSGTYTGSHRQSSLHSPPQSRNKDSGKRKLFEMESPCDSVIPTSLPKVHMEVVEALASLPSHSGASSPSKKAADSYK
jgi:hypothetical protein